jgi:peptidoglycan/xylan/chitin deacetylase (PgdA/CDA1 family)
MYHYVRPVETSQLRYLAVEDFEKQLDWLKESVGEFITEGEWESAKSGGSCEGVLLTFDDGLKDHFRYVLPILKRRGIFAIFFVSTAPLVSKSMLAVHLTHNLLSTGKSEEVLDFFHHRLPGAIWRKLDVGVAASAYTKHVELNANVTIKKLVNYLFTDFDFSNVLESAANEFLSSSLVDISNSWYMSDLELRAIADSGMKIGSHSRTHRLLSLLSDDEALKELSESKNTLEEILSKEVDEFCYPYGGPHSYNENIKKSLSKLNYVVAHDVSPYQYSKIDFRNRYALPRFDCNEFPFGITQSLKN